MVFVKVASGLDYWITLFVCFVIVLLSQLFLWNSFETTTDMAVCNGTSGWLSGINPLLSLVLFSPCVHQVFLWTMPHYRECYCCLPLILWNPGDGVLMIVWTLPPCYLDMPSSCCDVILSGGFTFVLKRCKCSSAYHEYRWSQMHELYTSISLYSVHAIGIVTSVNEHWDPCSAIYSRQCVYFTQLTDFL